MDEALANHIQLIKSVFKGREDVFAVRWEKGNKSGYMPAYYYDPFIYRAHKMQGGTFQDYNDKEYLELTDKEIIKHLNGEQQIGIYPLLKDNTSWFLVADFDKENWISESKKFINACNNNGIPTYLERSRSGNGGHVWIFFGLPYPAFKSRKIFISILEHSGAFSVFDKSLSFDRLFPNQDFHSGKGLGNLIAMPFYKKTFDQGNSCFIDKETLLPVSDTWQLLKDIKRISEAELDRLYQKFSASDISALPKTISGKLNIELNSKVKISRDGITIGLINFLKEELILRTQNFL